MDKVQIYYIVMWTLSLVVNIVYLARGETPTITPIERMWYLFISIPLSLPIMGRLFNWW